jgi:hypothetical protein
MTGDEQASTIHVHPPGDLIEHEITDGCPCGPRQQPVKSHDGSVGWLVVHHSLDGREEREHGRGGGVVAGSPVNPRKDPH